MEMLLIFLLVGAVMLGIAYFSHLSESKRRQALAAFAAERGWQFDHHKDRGHDDRYSQFAVFRRGDSRAAYNTLAGNIEIAGRTYPARMGDFTYKTGSGKSRSTHRISYLIVHSPFLAAPSLLIRPEGMFDRLLGAVGFEDINFESAEFSREFFVKSSDRRFAFDVVHPRMIEFLLAASPPVIDFEHGACCFTNGRSTWRVEDFPHYLDFASRFFEQWPPHLVAELEAPAR